MREQQTSSERENEREKESEREKGANPKGRDHSIFVKHKERVRLCKKSTFTIVIVSG